MANDTTNGANDHTAAPEAAVFTDTLTQAVDAFGREQNKQTTGDLVTAILERVSSITTAAELRTYARMEAAQGRRRRS